MARTKEIGLRRSPTAAGDGSRTREDSNKRDAEETTAAHRAVRHTRGSGEFEQCATAAPGAARRGNASPPPSRGLSAPGACWEGGGVAAALVRRRRARRRSAWPAVG